MSLSELIAAVDRDSFDPVAVLPEPGRLSARLEKLDIPIHYIPMETRRRRHPIAFVRSRKALERWLRHSEIDVVHANSFWAPELVVPAAAASGARVVYHLRDFYDRLDNARKSAFRRCDRLIAISKCVAADVEAIVPGLPITVIYNFVDSDVVQKIPPDVEIRRKLGWDDKFVIGVASRLSPEKGQMEFLYAASVLARKYPHVRFLVVGGSQFSHRAGFVGILEEELEKMGLTDKISFTGFVDNVASVYKTMDVCVLASIHEPFGRVVIESMACGTPVVATRSGGPEEILEDGVTGLLVEPASPESLASACGRLVDSKDLRDGLAARALEAVRARFSPAQARHVEALYQELAEMGRR